jgi:hypothetical protein
MTATISPEALKRTAQLFKTDDQAHTLTSGDGQFNLKAYLENYGIAFKIKTNGEGNIYVLKECLFDSSHTKGDASIIQRADGTLGYKCFHDSCKKYHWEDARGKISGDDSLRQFSSMFTPTTRNHTSIKKEVPWPLPLADEVFYGLAGEFVKTIEPHTEADPVALLTQFLVAFGNVIGRGCWFTVESKRHYFNLFLNLVGDTSKGRKGTAFGQMKNILKTIDPEWSNNSKGGLSSGEGLIWAVRDPILKNERNNKTRQIEEIMVDAGIDDKRLLVIEEEFASDLRVMEREGNTLSATIRKAWDDGDWRS